MKLQNLTTKLTRVGIVPTLALLLLAVGCASPEQKELTKVRQLEMGGNVTQAWENSKALLENPGNLSEKELDQLREIHATAERRLINYHQTQVNHHLQSGNVTEAVTLFYAAKEKFPMLEQSSMLNKQIMRAMIRERNFEGARSSANAVLASNPSSQEQLEVTKFLDKLDELEEAYDIRMELKSAVDLMSSVTGIDYSSMESRATCMAIQPTDKLSTESQALLDQYFESLSRETALLYEMGVIERAVN